MINECSDLYRAVTYKQTMFCRFSLKRIKPERKKYKLFLFGHREWHITHTIRLLCSRLYIAIVYY